MSRTRISPPAAVSKEPAEDSLLQLELAMALEASYGVELDNRKIAALRDDWHRLSTFLTLEALPPREDADDERRMLAEAGEGLRRIADSLESELVEARAFRKAFGERAEEIAAHQARTDELLRKLVR